jgi:hypothetical protein
MRRFFELQQHQKFVQRFFGTDVNISNVLFLFHSTGSGKTCSAVLCSEHYIKYLRCRENKIKGYVYIFSNKSSEENFIKELTGDCGKIANNIPLEEDNPYITKEEIENIESLRLKGNYKLYRHQKREFIYNRLKGAGYRFFTFQTLGRESIFDKIDDFNNSLIIVDEAHTFLNENKFVQAFNTIKERSKNYRLLLLSATPMINTPENIVNFINIMYPKSEKVERSDIFTAKQGALKKDGLNIIANKFKGKVSYIYSINPAFYPRRINLGETPKGLLKFTKITRIPMSPLQYKTYLKHWDGYHIKAGLRNIIDFVLPKDIFNLSKDIYKLSMAEREKLGIDVYESSREVKITGRFLELKNLSKYSAKYAQCMKDIINNKIGHTLIFSHYVHNSGIKLFGEIMKRNGFDEYGTTYTENSRHYLTHEPYYLWRKKAKNTEFISAKYVVFYNVLSIEERNNIIKLFKSPENRDGRYIKYILGSQLIKESIDLSRIRHVRILGYQDNFSRLEQIIGRAIRFNSHMDVEPVCFITKYVSSLPDPMPIKSDALRLTRKMYPNIKNPEKWSAGELEYYKDEQNHIIIKKIERTLKLISLDCKLNKDNFSKSMDFTRECDYQKCKYQCLFDDYNFKEIYNQNSDMIYKIYYSEIETYSMINTIKKLFYNNIIISHNTIINSLINDGTFINMALKMLTENKLLFQNKYGTTGYLQFVRDNYLFHPKTDFEDPFLPINIRGPGINYMPKPTRNIEEELLELSDKPSYQMDRYNKIKKKLKGTKYKVTKSLISREPTKIRIKIVEYAIKEYRKQYNSGTGKLQPHVFNILKFFRYYLIDNKLIKNHRLMYNANFDEYFDKNVHNIDRNKDFIGHIVDHTPKIINDSNDLFERKPFSFCLDTFRNIPENDYIVGFITKSKGILNLKLRHTEKLGKIKDRRNVRKGFKCVQINNKENIKKIYMKIADKPLSNETLKKTRIVQYCTLINKELRKKQYYNKDIRWFYDYYL